MKTRIRTSEAFDENLSLSKKVWTKTKDNDTGTILKSNYWKHGNQSGMNCLNQKSYQKFGGNQIAHPKKLLNIIKSLMVPNPHIAWFETKESM